MVYRLDTSTQLNYNLMVAENLVARFAYLSRAPQGHLSVEPEITEFNSDIVFPHYLSHLVLQSRFDTPEGAYGHINRVIQAARARGGPAFWAVGPTSQPADLGSYLEAYGFTTAMVGTNMVINLNTFTEIGARPAGLHIKRVMNTGELRDFVSVLATNSHISPTAARAWFVWESHLGFDNYLPHQRYVGYWQGQPVATSVLFSHNGVGGLYHVATLPEVRGRGIARAMCQEVLQDARWLGHPYGVLISTPMAVKLYQGLGFLPVGENRMYKWQEQGSGE